MAMVVGRGGSFASDPAGDPALRALERLGVYR